MDGPEWRAAPGRNEPDRLRLLDGGAEAFPPMLAAIHGAREEVFLEAYRFDTEGIGAEFLEALEGAARRGVRVRVVVDGWGSVVQARGLSARLRSAGCDVEIFNRVAVALLGRWRRNHRKILAVDGEVVFLGGINVGDEYGLPGHDRRPGWADLALEIRGPAAAWAQRRARRERGRSPPGRVRIWLSGLGGARRLRRRYLKAIGAARERVTMAHAYFLPDRHLVRSITAAARRGVRVRILLPGRSDVAGFRPATRRLYRRLLAAGVELREWPATVLHAKVAVADGRRLLLGSFNLDPFSLANLEALAEVEDPGLAGAGERWIEARMAEAELVLPGSVPRSRLRRWWEERVGGLVAGAVRWLGRFLARR
jgi:cardiolipin synthase